VGIPVTVKTRLGVDGHDSFEFASGFIHRLAQAGCRTFIVHARKAYLSGLSPKQNRDVPPLNYEWVYDLKREMPELEIVVNGGIDSLQAAQAHLEAVDGVMIGRAAYQNPWILAECQQRLFGGQLPARETIVEQMGSYIERQVAQGVAVKHVSRHMLGLFQGLPGARAWRRHLSENAHRDDTNTVLLQQALAAMKGRAR
jgi:tRNA-dihydrouridine synthase A